jgi:hypothetical protein
MSEKTDLKFIKVEKPPYGEATVPAREAYVLCQRFQSDGIISPRR